MDMKSTSKKDRDRRGPGTSPEGVKSGGGVPPGRWPAGTSPIGPRFPTRLYCFGLYLAFHTIGRWAPAIACGRLGHR